MRFEDYDGMRVMRAMRVFEGMRVMKVLLIFEGFEGKYSNSKCF